MCGIAGVVHLDGTEACPGLLRAMASQVRHRGPDAMEVAIFGPAGLGHARLSIIDLEAGRQPMRSRDGRLVVSFNGEIFNYVELRESLIAKGRRFDTCSDTEVILHAYDEYAQDCVSHFNGQWAFAIWDRARRRLFLSRDRLGVRPLYYTQACGKFLFASEIKSLFVDPDVIRQIEPRGLSQLFTFWATLPPTTVYQGVEELAPGCNLTLEDGRMEVRPYWRLEYGGGDAEEEEYADRVVELLGDAARLRLRADVAVGAYLSGGLDSSFVTALIHKEAGARLRTFSVTFEEPEFDESRQQRLVADHLGTDHRAVHCPAGEIARVFPEVIWHTEAPVLRTAPAPLFLLSKLVRDEGFKVVLTGEGADEMLGGYDIFKEAKVRRFCAAQPESAFRAALLGRLYPYLPRLQAQPLGYRRAFFRTRREDLDNPFFSHLPRWRLTSQLTRLFSPELLSMLGQYDAEADARALLPEAYSAWDPFCQAQYLETAILLPGYILSSQGDRVSLAHSVEGRHPFLDYRFVELAARIPPRLKMKALKEKFILKRAAKRFLPSSVVERPKQPYRAPDAMSFFHPESARARGDYIEELLSPERIRADGVFQPDAVRLLVQKVRRGEPVGVRDNMAFVGVLSTQLLIEQFLRNFPRAAAKRFAAAATPAWRQEPQTTGLCGRC